MTLSEIRTMLVSVDPKIRHYFTTEKDRDYTYWEETRRLGLMANDHHDDAFAFYVHRFTRDEFDPIARHMFDALDGDPRVAVRYSVSFEADTGYIHHVYECEAV